MAATDPLYGPGIATPPTALAAMPDSLDIVEAEHGGHLHLSYPGEPAWRVPSPQTAALRDALWTALDSKGAPDLGTWATEPQRLRRLPPRYCAAPCHSPRHHLQPRLRRRRARHASNPPRDPAPPLRHPETSGPIAERDQIGRLPPTRTDRNEAPHKSRRRRN
jgi:hypothetical protein